MDTREKEAMPSNFVHPTVKMFPACAAIAIQALNSIEIFLIYYYQKTEMLNLFLVSTSFNITSNQRLFIQLSMRNFPEQPKKSLNKKDSLIELTLFK